MVGTSFPSSVRVVPSIRSPTIDIPVGLVTGPVTTIPPFLREACSQTVGWTCRNTMFIYDIVIGFSAETTSTIKRWTPYRVNKILGVTAEITS